MSTGDTPSFAPTQVGPFQYAEPTLEHRAAFGEWGCVHSADDIRGGLCPEQRPGELDIITTLAEGYGLAEQQGDQP